MACPHKFETYLKLDGLDFKPTKLFVGTFNPAWPETNRAQWFYGRTENNFFWEVLPRLYDHHSLINMKPKDWRVFCKEYEIAITDLIISIEDAEQENGDDLELLAGYSDKAIANSFTGHQFNDIVNIIKDNPTICEIYLTRSANEKFWKDLWRPIKKYAKNNRLKCETLLTPSGYAFYQQGKYNNQNPYDRKTLPDYILMKWKQVVLN